MPMGYCQNLYCIGLSQDNHCKYITLAQIGLILVNSLVVLKLIFIIAKRKKKKRGRSRFFRYKNPTNFFFTINHTSSVTGMSTVGIIYWHLHLDFLYFHFLPQVHPFLSLQLTIFILLTKSTAFQKLSNSNSFHCFGFS